MEKDPRSKGGSDDKLVEVASGEKSPSPSKLTKEEEILDEQVAVKRKRVELSPDKVSRLKVEEELAGDKILPEKVAPVHANKLRKVASDMDAKEVTISCKQEREELIPEKASKLKVEEELAADEIFPKKVVLVQANELSRVSSDKDAKEELIPDTDETLPKKVALIPDKASKLKVDLLASISSKLKVSQVPSSSSKLKINPVKLKFDNEATSLKNHWYTSPESGAYAAGAWGPGEWSSSSKRKIDPDKLKFNNEATSLKKHWYTSPESGAYAAGAWGPGEWSSCSSSMPMPPRLYIDTWGKGHGPEDLFGQSATWFTDENGLPNYLISFKRADQAMLNAAKMPRSQIILETKTRVMTYWRSPSSQSVPMNLGEDLMAFGKRSHWSILNLGVEIPPEEYFAKMELQSRYAEFMHLDEEKNATKFYVPFSLVFEKVRHRYPDDNNVELAMNYDRFRKLILPGLWEDVYDKLKGVRSPEVYRSLSKIMDDIQRIITQIELAGSKAFPIPEALTWWRQMDEERRQLVFTFFF